ncbi:hypothetical protein DOY81_001989 [Sarcophaga bullata]|nr:hypothetical protein DOY81_001989 [Sarcophaga bullata]
MAKPPANMFFHILLTYSILLVPCIRSLPSSSPLHSDAASFYSSSSFISSPSIYSYTIENQLPWNQTATIYQSQSHSQKYRPEPMKLGATNRDLYFTSSNTNLNSNINGNSRRASAMTSSPYSLSSLASTTTSSSPSVPAATTMEVTPPAPISDCTLDRLAVYKVVLHTYWTRDLFPKHYPDWRPTAQWTKTLGRTHDSSFALYHIGKQATAGVKQFAETVSLMTRIVPSPDWFIGVDSFQLCVGGSWIDTVTVEMDPLDAGTDNGFTFTAPNWPTSPQGVIYRITSRYPAHPAGSFFYPKSKRLPPIATFQFIKLKEYELSEVFNFAEDDRKYETVQTQTHLEMEHNHVEMNNELSASIERERQNEIMPQPTRVTERDRIRSKLLEKMNPINNASTLFMEGGGVIPKNDKQALMQSIAKTYRRSEMSSSSLTASSSPSTSILYANTNRRRRTKRTRDCRVSHWSEWSDCSKTCGIGEMHRYRKVIKHGKRGGRPCPPLKESKWCGSEKGCHKPETYFNWSNT